MFETSRVRFVKEGDKIGLLIIHVRPLDAGNYKVILTNMFGQSTSSAVLSVDGKLQVPLVSVCSPFMFVWLNTFYNLLVRA